MTAADPIDAALAVGDIARATALAEAALAGPAPPADPFLYSLTAWALARAGDTERARRRLDAGQARFGAEPTLLTTEACLLRLEGRHNEAIAAADRALALAPGHAPAWLERGFAADLGGALAAAWAAYEAAVRCDPGAAAGHAGLASIAARQGAFDAARRHAAAALARDPGDAVAAIALARGDLDGEPGAAIGRLRALLARDDVDADNRLPALALLADALDRTAPAEAALAAYEAANAAFAARHAAAAAAAAGAGERQTALIARIDAATRDLVPAVPRGPAPPPLSQPVHAFLIGYPRSGTTLVETILASLPGVAVIEEAPTLRDADPLLLGPDIAGALAGLDDADIARLVAGYRRRAVAAGAPAAAALLVDMDPLKGMKLPVIARLFPEARIVVMRRDPRDVVWSCFRTSFALSAAALDFTSLEGAARHYHALMTLQDHWAPRLGAHVVRYEGLVGDFDGETRRLCAALGLAWSPAVRDFAATARGRDVATASVGQVRRGLFDGRGQWVRHAAALEAVRPILAPWVERFGYAPWPVVAKPSGSPAAGTKP